MNRDSLYNDTLCELDALIKDSLECKQCIIGGDFITDFDCTVNVSKFVGKFVSNNQLQKLNVLIPVSNKLTHVNEANHCGSTIDYFLTTAPSEVIAFNIIDLDINLSDHRPVMDGEYK